MEKLETTPFSAPWKSFRTLARELINEGAFAAMRA